MNKTWLVCEVGNADFINLIWWSKQDNHAYCSAS